ncbi:MAG: hypothetical protein WD751_04610 [Anaerolineales bacterium]
MVAKQRAPRWLSENKVEIFFLLFALLPALYIAFGNPNTILDWYSSDDGFYYFQVARTLAAGHGFTFDGLNPTNGFHPLWLFLITPLFLLAQFDLLLPLRLLLVVSALLSAGTAILLYRLLRRYTSAWVAAFTGLLWIVLPRIHDLTLHTGTEAGLNAFCILLFWYTLVAFSPSKDRKDTLRGLVWLGLLGSLAILARLDNVFIVGFGGLWLLARLLDYERRRISQVIRTSASLAVINALLTFLLAWVQFTSGHDDLLPFAIINTITGVVYIIMSFNIRSGDVASLKGALKEAGFGLLWVMGMLIYYINASGGLDAFAAFIFGGWLISDWLLYTNLKRIIPEQR